MSFYSSIMIISSFLIAFYVTMKQYESLVLPQYKNQNAPKDMWKRRILLHWRSELFVLVIGLLTFPRIWIPLLSWGLCHLSMKWNFKRGLGRQQRHFQMEAYKVYRFLAVQMSAGIRASDILKTLPLAVESTRLKAALSNFSNAYTQTMNFDVATQAFSKHMDNKDSAMLLTVIQQSLDSGKGYELVKNQEKLLVNLYFNHLEVESQLFKLKGSLLTIGWCFIIFMLLAVPMVYEMFHASHSIFN